MIAHLLNRTVQVWRPATAADGQGGRTTTFTMVATVAARLPQPSPREVEIAQRHGARQSQPVYVVAGTDIRRGDQLRDGPLVLEVLSTVTPSIPAYLKCECEYQQDGSV